MKRLIGGRGALVAVCVVALFAAGGGYAVASGGSSITVCVSKHGGALYKAKSCKKGDKKLSWSKQGPQGVVGAKGATGATGATGPQGPPGVQGPAGTARAWALVGSDGTITRSSAGVSASLASTGTYCVELPSTINAAQEGAVVSPYYPGDTTSTSSPGTLTDVEYDGSCGTNGVLVLAFSLVNGTSLTIHDQSFFIIVP